MSVIPVLKFSLDIYTAAFLVDQLQMINQQPLLCFDAAAHNNLVALAIFQPTTCSQGKIRYPVQLWYIRKAGHFLRYSPSPAGIFPKGPSAPGYGLLPESSFAEKGQRPNLCGCPCFWSQQKYSVPYSPPNDTGIPNPSVLPDIPDGKHG